MSIAQPANPAEALESRSERPPTFGERFSGILFRPSATFARMWDPDAWFWPSILMLVGYTVYLLATGVGSAAYQMSVVGQMLPPSGPGSGPSGASPAFRTMMLWVFPATQIFATCLAPIWSVAATWGTRVLVFTGLARLLGGERVPWPRVFGMVGWSWTPLFFHYVLLGVLMLVSPGVFRFLAAIPDSPGLGATADALRARWQGQALLYLSPFVLWNLWLCFLGVREVFRLPGWKSALVVLLPTVLHLLLTLVLYWLGLALMDHFRSLGTLPGPGSPTPPGAPPSR